MALYNLEDKVNLLCSEDSVTSIAKARNDILFVIQILIH